MAKGQPRRILRQLTPYRRYAAMALLCSLAQALAGLAPALVLRLVINDLAHRHTPLSHIGFLVALGALAVTAAGLLRVAGTYLTLRISKGVVADLRGQLFDRLLQQSVGFHTNRRAGELISNVLNDVGGIDTVISVAILGMITASCSVLGALIVMIVLSWQLMLITIVMGPVVAILLRLTTYSIYHRRKAVQEQFAAMTTHLLEALGPSGIMLIKSLGRESDERARFAASNREMQRLEISSGMAGQWLSVALAVLQVIGPAVILIVGSLLVLHGVLSLGTVIAFGVVAAAGFAGGLLNVANGATSIISSLPLWDRIFAVLDEEPEVTERKHALALTVVAGSIEFENVTFAYSGQLTPALVDVSATVPAGALVALVGPSGAGKTTFSHLAARFYDPQSGRVLLDGHDLRDLTLVSISQAIGLVLQDTYLLHASVRDNLRYAQPEATEEELLAAIHNAALDGVIAGLPDGLDTTVGERGYRLSGGEKQRLAIARIMLKDPAILILDEATSHLDSVSESLIQTALQSLYRGRTSIVIAHRLSTIRSADLILVLDQGRIVERGTHHELSQAGGLYAHLHTTQFRGAG